MYGKLFVQMYDGTLATKGPWQALVTFQQLLILADKHGIIDMTIEAISRRTTIPLEIIQNGIQKLLEPDDQSRSPHEEGKRIVPLSETRNWGWKVVNYEHYRAIRSEDERREYHKQYMRKRRAVNQNVKESTPGDQCQPIAVSSKQEADTEALKPFARSAKAPTSCRLGEGLVLETIPLVGDAIAEICETHMAELERIYPGVDPLPTLREIRGWNLANPSRRKTSKGIASHINNWFQRDQNRG